MQTHEQMLEEQTGMGDWTPIDGPDSRCGTDYWYQTPDGTTAYVNDDQGHVTITIDED